MGVVSAATVGPYVVAPLADGLLYIGPTVIVPLIPISVQMLLWAVLLIGVAVFLGAVDPLGQDASASSRFAKAAGVLAPATAVAQGYGALSGASDPMQPLGRSCGRRLG